MKLFQFEPIKSFLPPGAPWRGEAKKNLRNRDRY
jgi:hypothetical protein